MFQDSDRLEVLIDEFSDVVAPDESHHHKQQQLHNALYVCKTRVFDIESGAFLSYPIAVQLINPYFTVKLTVGEKAVDGLPSEEVDVALHEVDTFLGVERAFLGQHGEQQRIGDSVMDRCILRKHESALAGESKKFDYFCARDWYS